MSSSQILCQENPDRDQSSPPQDSGALTDILSCSGSLTSTLTTMTTLMHDPDHIQQTKTPSYPIGQPSPVNKHETESISRPRAPLNDITNIHHVHLTQHDENIYSTASLSTMNNASNNPSSPSHNQVQDSPALDRNPSELLQIPTDLTNGEAPLRNQRVSHPSKLVRFSNLKPVCIDLTASDSDPSSSSIPLSENQSDSGRNDLNSSKSPETVQNPLKRKQSDTTPFDATHTLQCAINFNHEIEHNNKRIRYYLQKIRKIEKDSAHLLSEANIYLVQVQQYLVNGKPSYESTSTVTATIEEVNANAK